MLNRLNYVAKIIMIPLLITTYVVTQSKFIFWVLAILIGFIFFSLLLGNIILFKLWKLIPPEKVLVLRESARKKSIRRQIGFIISLGIFLALLNYVNIYLAVLYLGCIILMQVLRMRVLILP